MSTFEGGILDRLVFDSFVRMLRDALDQLAWFDVVDSGRTPVTLITAPVAPHEEIQPNTISVQFEDQFDEPAELGSGLTFDNTMVWVEIYPESMSVGRHLAGDVRDILRGKMPSIGRDDPTFEVVDLTTGDDPPDVLFLIDIDKVEVHRDRAPTTTAGRFWFAVSAILEEERP